MIPQPTPTARAARSSDEQSTAPRQARTGSGGADSRRPPPFLDGPAPTLIALGLVVVLAVMMLGAGFSRSPHRVGVESGAYQQSGTFSYSAAANAPTAVYPTGTVKTGDPIYPSLVDNVTLRFGYQLTSALPHRIKGTVVLRALVLSQADTWQEVSTVVPITRFSRDKTSISTDLPLASLYSLIDRVSTESGVAGASYSVDIQPVVHITGTVGTHRINDKFSPVLPFAVSKAAIRVDVAGRATPTGRDLRPGFERHRARGGPAPRADREASRRSSPTKSPSPSTRSRFPPFASSALPLPCSPCCSRSCTTVFGAEGTSAATRR